LRCEAEDDQIVTGWTRERTKHEAMAQLSAVGVPVGAVLEPMELTNEPSFRRRGILQTMTHGERTMMMPNWPVRFDGVPTAVKSAPLLGEHTAEVLADWLGLDAAAVPRLRRDGIVCGAGGRPPDPCGRAANVGRAPWRAQRQGARR
jgi:crotonobetainyl-CoA:carnitine CoA-transferase CaiB-like acyl-CoA transferase